jgi:hypothetical protein
MRRFSHEIAPPALHVGRLPAVANFVAEGLNEIALRERAAFRT